MEVCIIYFTPFNGQESGERERERERERELWKSFSESLKDL
jgi:hypothetical protein